MRTPLPDTLNSTPAGVCAWITARRCSQSASTLCRTSNAAVSEVGRGDRRCRSGDREVRRRDVLRVRAPGAAGQGGSCACVGCSPMASVSRCNRWQIASVWIISSCKVRDDLDLGPTTPMSRLTGWAARFVDPDALVVDDTGFPKDGTASPGVPRMYCGALGKRGNCQIGVSVRTLSPTGPRPRWIGGCTPTSGWRPFEHSAARPRPTRQDPLAHRARLPRTQRRPRLDTSRAAPGLAGAATSPSLHRTNHLHHPAAHPKSPRAGLTLYAVLRRVQRILATWNGHCHTCNQPLPIPARLPQT